MRFRVEHEFPASRAAVAELLSDGAFHAGVDLPDLSRPEILEQTASGTGRVLRCRYEFVGHLDPVARRILGGRRLTWIQEVRIDTATGAGRLTFAAEGGADRLYGDAVVALDEVAPARTRRRIDGAFFVKVPLVGGQAERRIVPGLVRRLGVEAAAATAALNP